MMPGMHVPGLRPQGPQMKRKHQPCKPPEEEGHGKQPRKAGHASSNCASDAATDVGVWSQGSAASTPVVEGRSTVSRPMSKTHTADVRETAHPEAGDQTAISHGLVRQRANKWDAVPDSVEQKKHAATESMSQTHAQLSAEEESAAIEEDEFIKTMALRSEVFGNTSQSSSPSAAPNAGSSPEETPHPWDVFIELSSGVNTVTARARLLGRPQRACTVRTHVYCMSANPYGDADFPTDAAGKVVLCKRALVDREKQAAQAHKRHATALLVVVAARTRPPVLLPIPMLAIDPPVEAFMTSEAGPVIASFHLSYVSIPELLAPEHRDAMSTSGLTSSSPAARSADCSVFLADVPVHWTAEDLRRVCARFGPARVLPLPCRNNETGFRPVVLTFASANAADDSARYLTNVWAQSADGRQKHLGARRAASWQSDDDMSRPSSQPMRLLDAPSDPVPRIFENSSNWASEQAGVGFEPPAGL